MSKEQVICAECGAEYTVYMDGNRNQKEYRKKNWIELCDDCHRQQRERAAAEAAKSANDRGLPKLTGTEKQIKWAEIIRKRKMIEIDKISTMLNSMTDKEPTGYGMPFKKRESIEILNDLIARDSAADWIDSRYMSRTDILRYVFETAQNYNVDEIKIEREAETEAKAEATVRPKNPKTETVADIYAGGSRVCVDFKERHEDFRGVIKYELGFTWKKPWIKAPNITTDIKNLMAETGHRLLSAGFIIRIMNPEIRHKAISGKYTPEDHRYISAQKNLFTIHWDRRKYNYFTNARRLTGGRWLGGCMRVPMEHYEEILDFAEIHGFYVGDSAAKLIDRAETIRRESISADLGGAPKKVERGGRPKLSPDDDVEIDPDLIEEA